MIRRKMEKSLREAVAHNSVVALLGPRQAGKTSLVKEVFPNYNYVLLEEPDVRDFALTDPRGFLKANRNEHGLIIDEAQYAPDLFSYIQGIVDKEKKNGMFILTGSQNFYLNEQISQSLAGRVEILTLLPLSLSELGEFKKLHKSYEDLIVRGLYPRIHAEDRDPRKWYQSYIQTYIERDIRSLKNIADLHLFQKFLGLCAGRIGQLLNWSELASDCGISTRTAYNWISLLEASYLVFLLKPYHKNFNKRLTKAPKLYFYDTGIACALLKIHHEDQIHNHYLKGNLFESFVISELKKQAFNQGIVPSLYFWRDQVGHEIDCILEEGMKPIPIEIKSAQTLNSEYFANLIYWSQLANQDPKEALLIYGGDQTQKRNVGEVVGWPFLPELERVYKP